MRRIAAAAAACLVGSLSALPAAEITVEVAAANGEGGRLALLRLAGSRGELAREATLDGIARFAPVEPGTYRLEVGLAGHRTLVLPELEVDSPERLLVEVLLPAGEGREEAPAAFTVRRRTGLDSLVREDQLDDVPRARHVSSILTTAPGVTTDVIDVDGTASTTRAFFAGGGTDARGASWFLDGFEITDQQAPGRPATLVDPAAVEQVVFSTADHSLEEQDPGLVTRFVRRRGANRHGFTVRAEHTHAGLQEEPLRDGLEHPVTGLPGSVTLVEAEEVTRVHADVHGPIVRDHLWYWIGATEERIDTRRFGTDEDEVRHESLGLDGQLAGRTTFHGWFTEGEHLDDLERAVVNRSFETTWEQTGPSPVWTAGVEHFFGSELSLAFAAGEVEHGFDLTPRGGSAPGTQIVVTEAGIWTGTFIDFSSSYESRQATLRGTALESFGGFTSELKFGFRYRESERTSTSRYGGDGVLAFRGPGGLGGSASLYRGNLERTESEHGNAWLGLSGMRGPWNAGVGLHVAAQTGRQPALAIPGNPLSSDPAEGGIPPAFYEGTGEIVEWTDVLPRAELGWAGRRWLVRATAAGYVETLSHDEVAFGNPVGPSSITYPWEDLNGDGLVQLGELDTGFPLTTSNYDPASPSRFVTVHRIDPALTAPRVREVTLGGQLELRSKLVLSARLVARERDRLPWAPLYDVPHFEATGRLVTLPPSLYDCGPVSGIVPGTGRAYTEQVCSLADVTRTSSRRPTYLTNRPGYEQRYTGLELGLDRRFAGRFMLRAWLTLNDWEQHQPSPGRSSDFLQFPPSGASSPDGDPTNLVPGSAADGSPVAFQSDLFQDVWLGTSRWQLDVSGAVHLPLGFAVSGRLAGREGEAIPLLFRSRILEPDGIRQTRLVQIDELGRDRYDDVLLLDLRASKLFEPRDRLRIELAVDVFNVLDDDTVLAITRSVDSSLGPWGAIGSAVEPRTLRLGARLAY